MTHPCRVPLHSISSKIINRAKSLAAVLAGRLAAGSQVVQESVCVYVCMLYKVIKTKIDIVSSHQGNDQIETHKNRKQD